MSNPYREIQEGKLVGYGSFPQIPLPKWPQFEIFQERIITIHPPKKCWVVTEFLIEYRYVFEASSVFDFAEVAA